MDGAQEKNRVTRRGLILRDVLAFAALLGITVGLFAVTLFLFRSFTAHRAELARRWYARGVRDLSGERGAGRSGDAVVALRTALSYAPAERDYQMKLAEALEEAGKTDEALAYFSNLWDQTPGDGPLNLELARLEVKRGDQRDAVRYYHAAIYGTWEGDGVERRREARLDLVRYLLRKQDLATARSELLIAAGNSDDPELDLEAAPLMEQAGDVAGALELYQKVIAAKPAEVAALEGAGKMAFVLRRFSTAQKLLERAREGQGAEAQAPAAREMLDKAERILELYPAANLASGERVRRIMRLRELARSRLTACEQPRAGDIPGGSTAEISWQQIEDRWKQEGKDRAVEAAMRRDASRQRAQIQLVYDTEIGLSQLCGMPTGDDALVLLMAKSPETVEQ